SGLKLWPEIFDIGRGDYALALVLLFQRRCELADSGDDVGAGCQCETRDISVTLFRRRTELPHRTKDDYPLSSGTSSVSNSIAARVEPGLALYASLISVTSPTCSQAERI